jgi:hypothetical protein
MIHVTKHPHTLKKISKRVEQSNSQVDSCNSWLNVSSQLSLMSQVDFW